MKGLYHTLEWLRMGGDLVFLLLGAVPLVIAVGKLVLDHRPEKS